MMLTAAGIFTGCQDRLQEEFQDPEKHAPRPEEIVPGMLTKMLGSRFFVLDYGEWYYTFQGFSVPEYAQIALRRPHPAEVSGGYWSVFERLDGSGDLYKDMQASLRFNWYYTDLKNWGLIRDEIEVMSAEELAENEVFFLAATVIKDAIGLQSVDNFNRIPYSEAFQGTKGVFFPKYDDAKEIYMTVLDDLTDIAARIPDAYAKMSSTAKDAFAVNDIAFGGDPQKWVQYCNALRLRHAVRMSGVDEAFAKTHIAAAIQSLPTEDFLWTNTQRNENTTSGGGGGIYSRAMWEMAPGTLIPNVIMQRMNFDDIDYIEGEDDPRLPVIATPTRYTETDPDNYQFMGTSMDYDTQALYWPTNGVPQGSPANAVVDNGPGITVRTFENFPQRMNFFLRNDYSIYNIATFAYGNIPSYMTSLAEVDLLLAEVAAKGLASTGKSPADHIRDAVVHSTDMWYYVNSLSNIWQTTGIPAQTDFLTKAFQPAKPSSAAIGRFADKIKAQMEAAAGVEGQMEVIMQQKYIHLNVLGVYELWAELRRTRHPRIEKLTANGVVRAAIPERLMYPSSELINNEQSYYEVQDEDNFTSPIFWLPESKKSESYYMDGYLPLKGFLPLPASNPNRPASAGGTDTPTVVLL